MANQPSPERGARGGGLTWRLLGAVVVLVLLWHLREPMVLFFAAVLVAATLRALAAPLVDRNVLPARWAVLLVVLSIGVVTAVGLWLLGEPLTRQLQELRDALPSSWQALRTWVGQLPFGPRMLDWIGGMGAARMPWSDIANVATAVVQGVLALLLVVIMGVYLAVDVPLYRDGLVRLAPVRHRNRLRDALDASGESLMRWLLGRFITMVLVGLFSGIGLWLLDMPLALTLGLIVGVLEFVPFFGPIAAGALAVLVSFAQGPGQALHVTLLFLAVQQIEGNILTPLVQSWAVRLPPVLSLASVVVFGALFGLMGVVVATPLIVVAMILVRRLWVEATLESDR